MSDQAAPKIHAAIAAIMDEVGGVSKGRKNVQQGYSFRGIADVYLACQPVMAKHQVHIIPHAVLDEQLWERTTKSGGFQMHIRQRIEFRLYHADGSFVPCVTTGEAMDTGDKASNKAMSQAMKYALVQAFALPEEDPKIDTEGDDPEETEPEAPPRQPEPQRPKAQSAPASSSASPPQSRGATRTTGASTSQTSTSRPVDAEHATALERIRGMVAKDLQWEITEALTWLGDTFGVPKLTDLTKEQVMLCKRLLLAKTLGEAKYQEALAEAREKQAHLLKAPAAAQEGAAA